VQLVPSLLASGFDFIGCIAANDPWTLAAWAREVDPAGMLRFYSDGNLAFGHAAGLSTRVPEWFLGDCLQRFALTADRGVVEKIAVERSPYEVDCSSADLCMPRSRGTLEI
jgi:peroxiredoxin